jgi:hypothetical protein
VIRENRPPGTRDRGEHAFGVRARHLQEREERADRVPRAFGRVELAHVDLAELRSGHLLTRDPDHLGRHVQPGHPVPRGGQVRRDRAPGAAADVEHPRLLRQHRQQLAHRRVDHRRTANAAS